MRLEFDDLLDNLRTALASGLEFEYHRVELDRHSSGDQLDALRAEIRTRPELKIIHLIGHGNVDIDGYLHLVPPDCETDDRTNLQLLCGAAQSACKGPGRELLLVIDTCHAGAAVDRLGLIQLDRIWVAVAAMPDQPTYDGVFTKAFTATLDDIAAGRINTDRSQPFVSMRTFGDLLADHLERLDGPDHSYSPQARTLGKFTHVKATAPEIFPNPRFLEEAALTRAAQADVDITLHEYLDEHLDVVHFEDRVGAFFTGRRTILNTLGSWIADNQTRTNLQVVTGSGGVGKSAVLGAIILAHHPQLNQHSAYRNIGQALRNYRPEALEYDLPFPVAAVHARQLRSDDVTASFARQLTQQSQLPRLPEDPDLDEFIAALETMPEPPLLILDALDEAIAYEQITDNLLRGLLRQPARIDGRPLCRMIVACRNETSIQRARIISLIDPEHESEVHDLDDTDTNELRGDLRDFLQRNLKTPIANARRIAESTAAALTAEQARQQRRVESAAHLHTGYGAFLVATLFARYLLRTGLINRPEIALARIPLTATEVLEMDLADTANQSPSQDRRAVLAALAHAKGQGMPASIAGHLARDVFNGGPTLDEDTLLRTGTDLKLYIRTAVDLSSGETLYRLFHQALVEHMIAYPRSAPELEAPA